MGCSIILSSPTLAGEYITAPDASQLREWLADLNHESYERREAASRSLIAAGPHAVEALGEGVLSEHAEAAWRAGCALESIAVKGDEQTLSAVASALNRLSQSGKPGLKKLAGEIRERQKQYRHEKAAATIQQFGGRLIGGYGYDGGAIALADGPIFAGGVVIAGGDLAPPPIAPIPDEIDLQTKAPEPAEPVALDSRPRLEAPPMVATPTDDPPPSLDEATVEALAPPPSIFPGVPDDPLAPPLEVEPKVEFGGVEPRIILSGDLEPLEGIEVAAEPAPPPAIVGEVILLEAGFGGLGGGFVVGGSESEPTAALRLDHNWRGGDEGLNVLKDLPEIHELSLQGTTLTDKALDHIALLPKLTNLQVSGGSKLTSQGLWNFRKRHPETTIFALGEAMLGVNADLNGGPCVLSSVFYNSGAYLAGLQQGDRITQIDGTPIHDFSDLTIAVFARKAGDKLRLEYERKGKLHQVAVPLKRRDVVEQAAR
jgi:hypothetical protein